MSTTCEFDEVQKKRGKGTVESMNSPSGVYGGLYTTIGGCFDVLASHVSPAASKTIHINYMCILIILCFKVNISHKIVPKRVILIIILP